MGISLLLDTQALAWWWLDDPRLPRAAIVSEGNQVVVSAASAWVVRRLDA
jgi:PIN domain nuclease of toxin-antitoxin system